LWLAYTKGATTSAIMIHFFMYNLRDFPESPLWGRFEL
jgi:hypothetical protein